MLALFFSGCSATFTKNTAVISSPGFPVAYPPNAACTWVIRVQPGLTISMSFAGFNMEDSSNCAKDSLEVSLFSFFKLILQVLYF